MTGTGFKHLYAEADSVTPIAYPRNDTITRNSLYGILGEKHMNREYISVIVDNKPTVIFKRNIIAVTKDGAHTEIICVNDVAFYTQEDYASVVKKIIG